MSVKNTHPLYNKRSKQWTMVRDFIEGEDTVKGKGEVYLPKTSGSSQVDYNNYKLRTPFVNITARVRDGMHGQIFRKYPAINVPEELSYFIKDVDLKGNDITQFMSDVVNDVLPTCFGAILLDLPPAGVISNLEAEEKKVRWYARYYSAENVINWDYDNDGLTYVVLTEEVKSNDDMFSHDTTTQYRVLLKDKGVYKQFLYKESVDESSKESNWSVTEIPIAYKNRQLDFIPCVLLPSDEPSTVMLYNLACCNRFHYIMSADYANGVHLTTLPTGYVTGHSKVQYDADGNEIEEEFLLGHDQFLVFEEPDAKVGTLVYSGEGLDHAKSIVEQSLSDMSIMGSRLIVPEKGVSESADSARIHRAGENAILATFAKNMAAKFSQLLKMLAKIENIDGFINIELSTDYDSLAFDPNAMNAIANLVEAKRYPLPYVYESIVASEFAPKGSSLEEYVTLLTLEDTGASPLEVLQAFNAIREGKLDAKSFIAQFGGVQDNGIDEDK